MPDDAAPLEIDGILDLHMFQPRDVEDLVPDYLAACEAAGIRDVRIIHGKGIGVLRTLVEKILREDARVESFGPPHDASAWGATVVRLHEPKGRP